MEKLSDHTLRKIGLCEDHFLITSFANATKNRLRRDAVPIVYENAGSASVQNLEVQEIQNDKMQEMHNVDVQEIENIEVRDITAASSSNNGNLIMEKQIPKEYALRTYRPATLSFETSAEEEEMEWVRLEPPIQQDIKCNIERNVERKMMICKKIIKKKAIQMQRSKH